MNQAEKKYVVKRMTEIKKQKELEIERNVKKFEEPETFTSEQVVNALKKNKYEIDEGTFHNKFYTPSVTQVIKPIGYSKKFKKYEANCKAEEFYLDATLDKLNKFHSNLSDKVMLGTNEEALNALDQMQNFKI